jgi:ribose transport system substrate-binding protein
MGHRTAHRAASAVLASVASLSVAACGGSDDEASNGATAETPAAKTDLVKLIGKPSKALCAGGKKYTVGFDVFSDTYPFAKANIENFRTLAKELGCIEPIVLVDNADAAAAVSNVKTFVQRKADAVVLAQVVSAAQPGLMRILENADVPAVATYITAPGAPFISINDRDAGVQGGRALGEIYKKRGSKDAQPYVIKGAFPDGGDTSIARMDGFVDGVRQVLPGLSKDRVLEIDTKADPATANARTLDVLARVPDGTPILIGGINDEVAQGMLQAAKQQGRGHQTLAMGQGGATNGRDFICRYPEFVGTVAYAPETWFNYLLPAAIALAEGQRVPKKIFVPTKVLTRDNIGTVYPDSAC